MKPDIDLDKTPIFRLFISYFYPSLVSMLVLSTYVIFDGIFVGQGIGEIGLAAIGICVPIFSLFIGIELLFGIGGAALVGVALGSGKKYKARAIFGSIIYFVLGLSVACSAALFVFRENLALMLGANDENLAFVMPYLSVILLGSPIILAQSILCSFARNDRVPRLVMISFLIGSLINITFDYIFIFIFKWGMYGASIATILGHFCGLLIIAKHFLFKDGDLYFIKAFSFRMLLDSLKSGFPPSLSEFAFGTTIIIMNVLLMKISTQGVTILSIIMYIGAIGFACILSISHGLQPIVSYSFGAGKLKRAMQTFYISVVFAFAMGVIIYSVLYFTIPYIARIFLKDDTMILDSLILAVRIYFLGYLLLGFDIMVGAFLQAIGRIFSAMIVSLAHNLVFMMILLPILANYFGEVGIWASYPLALLCACVVSIFVIFYELKLLRRMNG